MSDAGPVAGGFGAYLGLLFSARLVPGYTTSQAEAQVAGWMALMARLTTMIVLCLPFLLMNMLVQGDTFDATGKGYAIKLMIFDRLVPAMGAAFCIYGLADLVCVRVLKVYKITDGVDSQEPVSAELQS